MAEINTVLTIDTEAARETLRSLVREARAEARADLEQTVMNLIDRVEALEDTTPLQAAVSDTTRFVQVRDDLWVNPALVAYVMADGSGTYVEVVNGGARTPWAIGDVLRALGVEG